MKKSRLLSTVCACVFSLVSIPAHAELIDNGGGLIYDTVLDITWAQNRNPAPLNWDDANTYASELTLGGASDWRLPYISVEVGAGPSEAFNPADCSSVSEEACRDNEMGYMFYQNLGGTEGDPVTDSGDPDLALFPNINIYTPYWTGTEGATGKAWDFEFGDGSQYSNENQTATFIAWAVHDGNVEPVDSIAVKVKGSVTKTMVADGGRWGGCVAQLDKTLADYGLNCPGSWVTFSCSGVYAEKGEAYRMFDQAQLALARKRTLQLYVDDTKKHNDYCFANQVRVFNK